MTISELVNFYDERFKLCFRAYFQELGVPLGEDTDVFDEMTRAREEEQMRALVLADEHRLAGFILFQVECLRSGFFEERVGFIRELWVAPSARGHGYGRQLLEAAQQHFRQENICKLLLTYEDDALGFYVSSGFRPAPSYTAVNEGAVIVKDI